MKAAASSSAVPPISPIKTMPEDAANNSNKKLDPVEKDIQINQSL